jgi:uncharacterized protein (TIGR02453 family)
MPSSSDFTGFPEQSVKFFKSLKRNNNKEWFHKNKPVFEAQVMEPAKAFVTAMGKKLHTISPDIIAAPKTNRSIFRIYRDTRFSPDKSPYKTHLGIFFWEGTRPKMECPGYYFHLEPPNLMLGVGLYMFPRNLLEHYRNAVVDPEYGAELEDALKKIRKSPDYTLGGQHYKRIPAGFDAAHPNAELLLHNGLYSGIEVPIPEEFYSNKLIDFCYKKYKPLVPLQRWLLRLSRGGFSRL